MVKESYNNQNEEFIDVTKSQETETDLSDTTDLEQSSPFELHGRLTALNETIQSLEQLIDTLPAAGKRAVREDITRLEHQVELINGYLLSDNGNAAEKINASEEDSEQEFQKAA